MIRVLVMANESLLADFIVSILSQEIDLDVFRRTRDDLGLRRDYSVVIVVDEGMVENESIKLKEVIRDDMTLLLIRVSMKSRNVYVDESYQLINPRMDQVVDLVRDFNRKNLKKKSEEDTDLQKKRNMVRNVPTEISDPQNKYLPVESLIAMTQVADLKDDPSIRVYSLSSSKESLIPLISLFLYQLRRRNPGYVTLFNQQGYLLGNNK